MAAAYASWAFIPQFNRIVNRNLEDEIDGFVLRHPDEMLLALAHAQARGGDLGTAESLGELFCQMDDLVDFRTAYQGRPLNTGPRTTGPGATGCGHAAPEAAE